MAVNDVTPFASASETQMTAAESTDRYYAALIAAFADAVVARLGIDPRDASAVGRTSVPRHCGERLPCRLSARGRLGPAPP